MDNLKWHMSPFSTDPFNYNLLHKYSVLLCHWVISGLSLDHPGHLGHILSWPSGSHPLTDGTGSDHVNKLQWSLSIATFAQ